MHEIALGWDLEDENLGMKAVEARNTVAVLEL